MTAKLRKYTIATLGSFCMLFALTGTGLASANYGGYHTHPEIQKYNQGITMMEQGENKAINPNPVDYSQIDSYRFNHMHPEIQKYNQGIIMMEGNQNGTTVNSNDSNSFDPDEWPDSCFSRVTNLPPQYKNSAYF